MQTEITLQNDERVARLMEILANAPEHALAAIIRGVSKGSQILLGLALKERFSGKGPYPVSQRQLGVVSGRLRKDLRFSDPEVQSGGSLRVLAGSTLSYWAAHEHGFEGVVQVPETKVRKTAKRKAHTRKAHSRRMSVKRRAPLGAAIEEHSARVYAEEVSKELDSIINNN